jgi:hypothetical protein
MIKVQVLSQCKHCNGEAYLPMGEAEDCQGHTYTRYVPCPMCEGSGNKFSWISLEDFAKLLFQAQCPHEHTSYQGSMQFSTDDVWDDIEEVCDDCGASLDKH